MKTSWIVAGMCAAALIWVSLAVLAQTSEQESARQLYRTLDRYSYYYDAIRSAESNVASRQLTPQEFATGVRDIEQRLHVLVERLNTLKLKGSVRRELLDPVVHGLRDDATDLASLRDYVQRHGFDQPARERVGRHVHGPDVFRPVVSEIKQRFGFRQRLWRGHPLTV